MKKQNVQTSWDLNLILSKIQIENIDDYRQTVTKALEAFIDRWSVDQSYLSDPMSLKTALDQMDHINKEYGFFSSEIYYYYLKRFLDESNAELTATLNKINDISISFENRIQFFYINLSKVPVEIQNKFLTSDLLIDYRYYLKLLFENAKHILSDKEEKIMNLKSKTSNSNWVDMISSILSKQEREILLEDGNTAVKSFSEIISLVNSKDKKVRDDSAKALNSIFDGIKEFAEHEINSVLENKKVNDEIRGYTRADESRHLSDAVDTIVVDTLVESVSGKFDIPKRFYKLKAKLFGLEKLAYHERNLDYGKIDKKIEFDEAYKIVGDVFASLDDQFFQIYQDMFENGQVDVFPKKGKHSGAYCINVLKKDPIYVLLNHTDRLNDVGAIAHEFGHAIHTFYSRTHQNSFNEIYSLATAETASTFFEDFVLEKISQTKDDELQLALQMESLNEDINSIFRQIAFYKFEKELHETFRTDGYISYTKIGEIFQKHMISYMGEAVSQDAGSQNWWIYIPHIRRNFYVYSYAFGQLVSKSLQNLVREDKKNLHKVVQFFKAGGSMSVKDIFSSIDIDITSKSFWEKGIGQIEEKLVQTENWAKRLGKL